MIKASNISHFYGKEQVLFDLDINIKKGEFVFLSGESGSGKSTLLSILSTLLKPSNGDLRINGKNIKELKSLDSFRQDNIGFVFQFHYLINYLNVYENIELAAKNDKKKNIQALLKELRIEDLSSRYPNEISGGQRQRVALARALINEPSIIFADEPTGSLDSVNTKLVYEILAQSVKKGCTLIIASHDMQVQNYATQTLQILDGKLQ